MISLAVGLREGSGSVHMAINMSISLGHSAGTLHGHLSISWHGLLPAASSICTRPQALSCQQATAGLMSAGKSCSTGTWKAPACGQQLPACTGQEHSMHLQLVTTDTCRPSWTGLFVLPDRTITAALGLLACHQLPQHCSPACHPSAAMSSCCPTPSRASMDTGQVAHRMSMHSQA